MFRLRGVIDGRERFFPMEGEEVRLGRGSDNDVVLPDFSVSRRHAALRREPGGWFVYDLKSTNGVQVNGVTVKKAPLRSTDKLKIGIFEFVVEGELTHAPSPTAQVAAGLTVTAPPGAVTGPGISSATIVRRLADFSADYGLEAILTPERRREDKRKALDQAYSNTIFGILTRLARMLIKSNTVDEVLEQVLAIAFEALSVDRGFILLRDDASGELVCELSRVGDKVVFRPEEVPVSKTMLEAVINERVALLTYDAQSDQRLATGESIRIHQIRSAMCAPLWSSDNIIGVMQVDSPFHAGTFNEGDLDLFTALANYAAVAVERIRYAEKVEHERNMRSRLERYHSPAVIEAVMSRGEAAEGTVHRLQSARVTVLFADVVGFTPLAENLPPEEVAEVLEAFFTHSVEAIFAEGGTLDKFIGDCVMAFFGAPMPQADHAARAARAAVAIQRAIKELNDERVPRGQPPLLSRIALNSGPVVVGDVGSKRRVDYTVLGNTVNVAARIEQAATAPGEIVIGGTTLAELAGGSEEFRTQSLGEFQLKGLVQKVPVYKILWEVEQQVLASGSGG
jgi:adenylate cyclase